MKLDKPRLDRPRRSGGKSALRGPLMFLGICAALVFAMSVFFRVSKIEVVGASHYTPEEVRLASGIDEGDNLFFINRFSVMSRIFSRLPYVDTADITRYLPGKVVLTVTESQALAYVTDGTDNWVVDRNGKTLKRASDSELAPLIPVRGFTVVTPEIGEIVQDKEESGRVQFLAAILDQIQARGLGSAFKSIDLADEYEARLVYQGRLTVLLGENDGVEYKFGALLAAEAQLAPGDQGTLDLSSGGPEVVFRPG